VSRSFAAGDRVLLVDSKKRRHLITLVSAGSFHTHAGIVAHDDLIGAPDGTTVRTSRGQRLVAVHPTLAEFVLEMPRGAQVIYPKDLGAILISADIFPGASVLESGIGSGALTTALLRAVGPTGSVVGYELRDDFATKAQSNVLSFLGADVPLTVEVRDVYDGIDVVGLDRVLLDLPEPWRVVKHAANALAPGGILLAYLPTIGQVARLREEMAESPFGMIESYEVLHRGWHVEGQSVRPDHRMVAHTGFITHGRLLAPGAAGAAATAVPSSDTHGEAHADATISDAPTITDA
jgi:tRNA (adenine57-N1/adenine58-N1)-methyltransferase catalytic subunit